MAVLTRRTIDAAIRANRQDGKARKLADGRGLHLYVSAAGGTIWRYRYRRDGRESQITLGSYPEHDIDDARAEHVAARRLVLDGGDPAEHRRKEKRDKAIAAERKAVTTVSALREKWLASSKPASWSDTHRKSVESRLRVYVEADPIDTMRLTDITPDDIEAWLERVQTRKVPHPKGGRGPTSARLDIAHRVRGYVRRMFDHAVARDLMEENPARHVKAELAELPPQKNHGHTLDRAVIGQLLRAPTLYGGDPAIGCALRLLPRLFCRPGELRLSRWREFDVDAGLWRVPADRMKNRLEFLVPLSRQVLDLLDGLRDYTESGEDDPVIPSPRPGRKGRPISDGALTSAYAMLGFTSDTITPHGWRHIASTTLSEGLVLNGKKHFFDKDVIERQLAHVIGGVRGIYNKAEHLPERVEMMQVWADYLDVLERGPAESNVVALAARKEAAE